MWKYYRLSVETRTCHENTGMLLVDGGDPFMSWKDVRILLADGGDPHVPREDDMTGGAYCNLY